MATRMIQSYHEGCGAKHAEQLFDFDRTSLHEQCRKRSAANCLNPLQIFSWMHKKLLSSFALGKTHDANTGNSASASTKSKRKAQAPRPSDSRNDSHYCTVQFARELDDEDDLIEPAYEDCPMSYNELCLPSAKYHSQLSDTSNATATTQQTGTTCTSGFYSLAECNNNDMLTVRKSVSVTNDWLLPSTIYSKVLPRTFDNRPPPLPSQRLYRQAEVEALLQCASDNTRLTANQAASSAQYVVAAEELENIYESIDKLDALPASESLYSLSRGKFGWRSSKLQQEIDGLRFIDSPSESLLSLDTRSGKMHGLLNPFSRHSSRRLLVESTELRLTGGGQAAML